MQFDASRRGKNGLKSSHHKMEACTVGGRGKKSLLSGPLDLSYAQGGRKRKKKMRRYYRWDEHKKQTVCDDTR